MFKCDDCERVFSKKSKLTRHFKETHLNVKEHICSECGKIFKRNSHLTRHQISHSSNPKPYRCEVPDCPMSFACKHHLERHIKIIHEQDSSYKCPECPAAFTKKLALNKHLSLQHGRQKPQECQICGKSFFKLGQLHFHSCERKRQRRNNQENIFNNNNKLEEDVCMSTVEGNMNMKRYYNSFQSVENTNQLGNIINNGNQYDVAQDESALRRENEEQEIQCSKNEIINQQQARQMFYEEPDSFQGFNGGSESQHPQQPVKQQFKDTNIFIKSEDSHEQQVQELHQRQAIQGVIIPAKSEESQSFTSYPCNPSQQIYPDNNLAHQNNTINNHNGIITHDSNSQSVPYTNNEDHGVMHSMNFNDLLKTKSPLINPTQRRLSEIFALSDSIGNNNYNINNSIGNSNRKGSFNNNDISIFKDLFTEGQSNNSNPHQSYWQFQGQNQYFVENSRNHNHPHNSIGSLRKNSSLCVSKVEEDRDILVGYQLQEPDQAKLEMDINTQPQQQQEQEHQQQQQQQHFQTDQTPLFSSLQQQSYPLPKFPKSSIVSSQNNLSQHNNLEKCYRCFYPDCDKFYTKLSNLKTHVRTYHHKSKDFKCNYKGCDAAYLHKKSLKEHVTRVHWIKQRGQQGEQPQQLEMHREREKEEEGNQENCGNRDVVLDHSNLPQSSFSQLNNQPLLITQHHNTQQYYDYSTTGNIHQDQVPQSSQPMDNTINTHDQYLPNYTYNNNNTDINPYASSQVQPFNFHPIMKSSVSDSKCPQEFHVQQSDSLLFHSNGIPFFQEHSNDNIFPQLQEKQNSLQMNGELSSNSNSSYINRQLRFFQENNSNNTNQLNTVVEQQQQLSQMPNPSNYQQQYQQNLIPIQQQQQQQNVFPNISSHFENNFEQTPH